MSRQKKKLIGTIVMAVILVFMIVVLIISKLKENAGSSADTDTASGGESADSDYLAFESVEDEIMKLKVRYQDEDLTFKKDSTGNWILSGEKEFPLDASAMTLMFTSLKSITSEYRIDDVTDMSEFGLDDPEITITVDMGDDPTVIKVGDQYPYGSSRYITVSDDPGAVYVAPPEIYSRFAKTKLDLIEVEDLPYIEASNITEIRYDVMGYEGYWLYCDNGNAYDPTHCYPWVLSMDSGNLVTVDVDKLNTLFSNATSFTFTSAVEYRNGYLADYGISDGSGKIEIAYVSEVSETVTDDEGNESTVTDLVPETLTVLLGNDSGDGYTYASLAGSDFVYKLSNDRIADLQIADPYALESDCPFMMDLTQVDVIRIDTPEYSHQFAFSYETETDEEGNSSLVTKYLMDGEYLTDDETNKFIGAIADLTVMKNASDRLNRGNDASEFLFGEIFLAAGYELKDGSYYEVIAYDYDESYCMVVVNGISYFRIDKRDVNAMIQEFMIR